jgi:hypothetical protein
MHHIVEPKAPEVEFLKLFEDPQEFEEFIEVLPASSVGFSDETNIFRNQGKPGIIYTY